MPPLLRVSLLVQTKSIKIRLRPSSNCRVPPTMPKKRVFNPRRVPSVFCMLLSKPLDWSNDLGLQPTREELVISNSMNLLKLKWSSGIREEPPRCMLNRARESIAADIDRWPYGLWLSRGKLRRYWCPAPQTTYIITETDEPDHHLGQLYNEITDGTKFLFIWGQLIYWVLSGKPMSIANIPQSHITRFCWKYDRLTKQFGSI